MAPGDAWPEPAPLPPDEPSRPWWKVAVPVVVVLAVLGLAAGFLLGRGGGGSDTSAAPATDKVDLSDIDDPASTTTRPTSTTTEAPTVTTPEGRFVVESDSGITWSMAAEPVASDLVSDRSQTPVGERWTAEDGTTTEVVEVTDLDGEVLEESPAIEAFAARFKGKLSAIEQSHIEEAPGSTASFTGTLAGEPVVGYVVIAQVGDQSLLVGMVREGRDLDDLYLDWLGLPSSVTLP